MRITGKLSLNWAVKAGTNSEQNLTSASWCFKAAVRSPAANHVPASRCNFTMRHLYMNTSEWVQRIYCFHVTNNISKCLYLKRYYSVHLPVWKSALKSKNWTADKCLRKWMQQKGGFRLNQNVTENSHIWYVLSTTASPLNSLQRKILFFYFCRKTPSQKALCQNHDGFF